MEFYLFSAYRMKHGADAMSVLFEQCIIKAINGYLIKEGFDPEDKIDKLFIDWDMRRDYNDFSQVYFDIVVFHTNMSYVQGTLTWYSKKGDKITPSTKIIDEEDVIFSVETGDLEIIREVFAELRKQKYVIHVKPIHYELHTTNYTLESIRLNLYFSNDVQSDMLVVAERIKTWINVWNEESQKQRPRKGVIHGSFVLSHTDSYLEYYVDFGSAGLRGLKYLLVEFNQLEGLEKVLVGS
jgi:hypothetical protein